MNVYLPYEMDLWRVSEKKSAEGVRAVMPPDLSGKRTGHINFMTKGCRHASI